MTEQEQIEKIARSMCGYCSTDGKCAVSKNGREPDICANVDTQHCLYKEHAETLIENGYGDVSAYKAEIEQLNKKLAKCNDLKKLSDWQREEIEQLKAEVNKGCDNCEAINRAKIDVLKELKTRHDYAIKNMGYPWDISQQIDELIKEVQNEQKD
jgi:hypothetical protein